MLDDLSRLFGGTPTAETAHAGRTLQEAANQQTSSAAEANGYMAAVQQAGNQYENDINSYFAKNYGSNKGPVQSARQYISECLKGAVIERYKLSDPRVIKGIAELALAFATSGWEGKDTTGTTMGNFKGSWPGGGFA